MSGPANYTEISWATRTWNVQTGCEWVSPECDFCYARDDAARLQAINRANGHDCYQHDANDGSPGFGVELHPERLADPLRWRQPARIFCNSMGDLLHRDVPPTFLQKVLDVIRATPEHRYLLLTKRPQRLRELEQLARGFTPNLFVGTSIGMNKYAWRADHLRELGTENVWLSVEPLLEPLADLNLSGMNWIVVGGESATNRHRVGKQSGRDFKPLVLDHARDLRDRCHRLGIPFYFKQIGGPRWNSNDHLLDGVEHRAHPSGLALPSDTDAAGPLFPEGL